MSSGQHKPVIGVVGGIGSGKSTVARQMASLGGSVFDADASARAALDDAEVREALHEAFGEAVFDAAGGIDRRALAEVAFDSDRHRRRLEAMIHPKVRADLDRHIAAANADAQTRFIVLDVPLLLEVGWGDLCDRIVYVDADRERRMQRLRQRGWEESELIRRENSQMPLDKKLKCAHDMVENNAGEAACLAQVHRLVHGLLPSPAS